MPPVILSAVHGWPAMSVCQPWHAVAHAVAGVSWQLGMQSPAMSVYQVAILATWDNKSQFDMQLITRTLLMQLLMDDKLPCNDCNDYSNKFRP